MRGIPFDLIRFRPTKPEFTPDAFLQPLEGVHFQSNNGSEIISPEALLREV